MHPSHEENNMNNERKVSFFIAVAFAGVTLMNSLGFAQDNVAVADFIKMNYQQRVQVCAQLVASEDIGHCASITEPKGEPVTVAEIRKIGEPCFAGGVTDSTKIAVCVRSKLDAQNVPSDYACLEDIKRAYEICGQTVSSTDIGACTASLCTRLEVK
jgi:hypothetical protein